MDYFASSSDLLGDVFLFITTGWKGLLTSRNAAKSPTIHRMVSTTTQVSAAPGLRNLGLINTVQVWELVLRHGTVLDAADTE